MQERGTRASMMRLFLRLGGLGVGWKGVGVGGRWGGL